MRLIHLVQGLSYSREEGVMQQLVGLFALEPAVQLQDDTAVPFLTWPFFLSGGKGGREVEVKGEMQHKSENKVLHTRSHVICCSLGAIQKLISQIFNDFHSAIHP